MAQNELNEIGEKISKDLKEALDTMDFSKLNDTVSDSVNLALKEAKERISKTAETISKPKEQWGDVFQQMPKTKEEIVTFDPHETYTKPQQKPQSQPKPQPKPQSQSQPQSQPQSQLKPQRKPEAADRAVQKTSKVNLPPKVKAIKTRAKGRVAGILSIVFGAIGLTFGAIMLGVALLITLMASGTIMGSMLVGFGLFLTVGFSILLGVGIHYNSKNQRLISYAKAGRGKEYISLKELSEKTGRKVAFLKKDLKKMLEEGMLPGSRMDEEATCLMFTEEAYKQYMEAKNAYEVRQLEEKRQELIKQEEEKRLAQKKAEEEKALSSSAELKAMIERGNEFLSKIKEANDAIDGEEISQKIDKLEMIIRQIFKAVRENPDEISEMDKFMEYYLPTTVKLLETYERFDKVVSPGENILSAKREIEKTLDTIERAFLSLLDDLYQDAAFDAEADAAVLKTMLEQEGLVKDHPQKEQDTFDFDMFV